VSDDGQWAIVVIALVGSPFSAAYARDRGAPAHAFCSMNVAVYGPRGSRFSLTERAISPAHTGASELVIGSSTMCWTRSGSLVVHLDERSTPWGVPIRGTVRLHPEALPNVVHRLDPEGRHAWWPVAPLARIEVTLSAPRVAFRGHGYHDANAGDVPLEASFRRWSWARARLEEARAAVLYDVLTTEGLSTSIAQTFGRDGVATPLPLPPTQPLPTTTWGIARATRADGAVSVVRGLEDGPFYARALVDVPLAGRRVVAMHEELSCERLARSWVRFLTGFRMRRAG